jgi:predicted DNA binding CopG/RHH family protein
MPRPKKKTGRFEIRLSEELIEQVKAYAANEGTTTANIVEQYLTKLVQPKNAGDDVEQV